MILHKIYILPRSHTNSFLMLFHFQMSGYNDVNMLGPNSYSNSMSPSHSTASGATEAIDLDSGGGASFLSGDPKHHDDLKEMLDSSKESLKLEAMKRIISMVARGRDASDLFPAVVKNVVSKNLEIKKLVYVYLTRYAEEQQDLALLSISTFQRALKDPNQLIRASALRVLSSIRVPVIVPIMMLAIRDSSVDMSPFVRKTAAHAIPKAYSIDPDQKEELVNIIEKLLGDRTTLVVGSAVMAFEEVCPERIDLVHKQFRKFCHLLVDVEEWGQVVIVNMLLRYARTQFVDPNIGYLECNSVDKDDIDFYRSGSEDSEKSSDDNDENESKSKKEPMDPDHRLLLKSCKPLLQSRNAAVVMAVAQIYHHCAPRPEIQIVAKAIIRLLRSHTEVQAIVLNCIASMTSGDTDHENSISTNNSDNEITKTKKQFKMQSKSSSMFEPHLRNFFVRNVDPSHIKILKLEIMTNLATESNIGVLLREFQSYITSQDKVCVAATIQAIGRCAATINNVTDTCLNGLVHLLSNRDQAVVAESVVVIKKLLQTQAGDHKEIIIHMAKLMDSIKVPAARAAILWVLGEYSDRVPKVAPDVLRKMAKSFTTEEPQVKMQILNLATKLALTNPEQTQLLAQYIFNLAKYDKDYDLRDRARFMRAFIFPQPGQENNCIIKHSKKIFLAPKPAPVSVSRFKDREVYQLGSMSHYLNSRAPGYQDLPDYPETAPDPSVRNVEPPRAPNTWGKSISNKDIKEKDSKIDKKKVKSNKGFYSDENSAESSEGSDDGSDSSDDSGTDDSSESSSSSSESSNTSDNLGLTSKRRSKVLTSTVNGRGTEKKINEKSNELLLFESTTTQPPDENKSTLPSKNSSKDRVRKSTNSSRSDKSSSNESSESDNSDESSSSSSDDKYSSKSKKEESIKSNKKSGSSKVSHKKQNENSTNLDLLLSLGDDVPPTLPSDVLSPSLGGLLTPLEANANDNSKSNSSQIIESAPNFISNKATELLNRISTGGLQLQYRYTRLPYIYSPLMTAVEFSFTNQGMYKIYGGYRTGFTYSDMILLATCRNEKKFLISKVPRI